MRVHRDASALLSEEHDEHQDERNEHQDERDEVIGNEALGVPNPFEFQRAPADVNGTNFTEDDRTECFACKYCKKVVSGGPSSSDVGMWTNDGVSDAYSEMCQLIDENYATVSNNDLFEMVFQYYEYNIRTLHDYGPWTKQSIANHIIFHRNSEDVQVQECTALLFAQVQSLRQKAWIKNADTGVLEPHHKNMLLLERYIKLLDDHLLKSKTLKK